VAPKKKPITVGKNTSYTRPKADGKAPRPVSAKPSDASKVRAAKKTTSSGITRRPDGKVQPEGRAARSSISKARVTSAEQTRPSGARGIYEKPNPKVTTGRGSALKTAGQVVSALKGLSRGGVAAAVMAPRPVGDATLKGALKRGDYKPQQGPKPSTTQSSFNKKTFDQAFKAARTSGAKQFTWRGKKYTTKMK
jgi:hypothetical protein